MIHSLQASPNKKGRQQQQPTNPPGHYPPANLSSSFQMFAFIIIKIVVDLIAANDLT
jgi:hypothetical protein